MLPYMRQKLISILLVSLLVSGCSGGGSNVVKYYLIDPVASSAELSGSDEPLAIEIIDLHLPQYLERFQIVTRNGDNRIQLSETNQWGENFRKNLLRTMARNLSGNLNTIDIGTPFNRSSSTPDYSLQIHIEQFEQDVDGVVKLIARWQINDADEAEFAMHSTALASPGTVAEGDYQQVVSEMQVLYGELGELIAETIRKQEER